MEKEHICRKGSSTEYAPTKCRITRPPPPKPATNPLQFIKVGPCPLLKKGEQEKKVEPVKVIRPEIRDEAEEWQHNLDSWKSNRRKRQEHIIERVEEVKKIEQECQDRVRKKRTTFNEILEKRNLGRPKFNIAIYQEDTDELNDFGVSGETLNDAKFSDPNSSPNSCEPVLEKDCHLNNEFSTEACSTIKDLNIQETESQITEQQRNDKESCINNNVEQYTYEGAIQNYRQRIGCNINESLFNKAADIPKNKEYIEVETLLPKGNLYKRKEIFESDKKDVEDTNVNESIPHKLLEDFTNTQSIKERLQSLEKCTVPVVKNEQKTALHIRGIIDKLEKIGVDNKDNEIESADAFSSSSESPSMNPENKNAKESCNDSEVSEQIFSGESEDEIFINKHNLYSTDLNALYQKGLSNNSLYDFTISYPPSTSSNELMILSSDKEDSGIHTADVSCSVSQSDEAFEDIDVPSNTIPKCIEKLNTSRISSLNTTILQQNKQTDQRFDNTAIKNDDNFKSTSPVLNEECSQFCGDEPLQMYFPNEDDAIGLPSYSVDNELFGNSFIMKLQPPDVKPPPPPAPVSQSYESPGQNSAKDDINMKRSTFLGLAKPNSGTIDDLSVFDVCSPLQMLDVSGETCKNNQTSEKWFESIADLDFTSNKAAPLLKNGDFSVEEDEIRKKEREIIELVENEEKTKTHDSSNSDNSPCIVPMNYSVTPQYKICHGTPLYSNFDDRDSEVLKVEHELLQLEREELKRQRENVLFREKNQEFKQNYHSYENLCDVLLSPSKNYCKSMPELNYPVEFNRKMGLPNNSTWDEGAQYYKSMSNINNTYNVAASPNSGFLYDKARLPVKVDQRKSMPDLQTPMPVNHLVSSGQSGRIPSKHSREFRTNHMETDNDKKPRPPTRHSLQSATEILRPRHPENWNKLKNNYEIKNYNQHWLIQEAEFRRISETRNPSLQYRLPHEKFAGANNKPCSNQNTQPTHVGHSQKRRVFSVPYSSSTAINDSQNVMLSVSGKKKCSYCGNELGRGAAMIIETLCLFYHMECFKCCVCHVELGDGLMGTDVRVRNQKLHCQNCYSSDDGIKFSCV